MSFFRTYPDFRMVVLPPLWDVLHRAGVPEPHLAMAGRRRAAGERRQRSSSGARVQGLAESAQLVSRSRIPTISNRYEKGTGMILKLKWKTLFLRVTSA